MSAEARSQKPEEDSPVQLVFFWLLTVVSGPFWLLASILLLTTVYWLL